MAMGEGATRLDEGRMHVSASAARTCAVCTELSALCSVLLTLLLQNRTNVIHFRLSSPQRFVAVYWAFEFGICERGWVLLLLLDDAALERRWVYS